MSQVPINVGSSSPATGTSASGPGDTDGLGNIRAPRTDQSQMGSSEHFVQFYESDSFLLEKVANFIGTALSAGDAGIIIATQSHREGIEKALHANGVDLDTARACGQYVSLDAAQTLSRFMLHEAPDAERFHDVIGGLVGQAATGQRHVRAFGEMVALLADEGNHTAVVELEALWNELQQRHHFSLFCAYPMHRLGGEAPAELLESVCTQHSHVIPAESYTTLPTADDRLAAVAGLQQKASWLEAEIAERQRAEERYTLAARATNDVIWDWDLATNALTWNGTLHTGFGYPPREVEPVIGWRYGRIHPDERDGVIAGVNAVIEGGGESWSDEYRFRRHDGSYATVIDRAYIARNETGEPVRMIGSLMDITERRRVEEELSARARQQAAVAQLGQRALAVSDLPVLMDEAVTLVASTLGVEYCKVLELLPDRRSLLLRSGVGWQEGLVGRATVGTGLDSQAGFTLASAEPVIVEDLRTERRFSGPPLLHNHGVISGMSVVIPGQKGPFGVLGTHTTKRRDFTRDDINFLKAVANVLAAAIERRALEQQVSEDRFRLLVQNSSDIILVADICGTIRYVSPSVERILGYNPEELVGTNGLALVHPDDTTHVRRLYDGVGEASGAVGARAESRVRHKDGSWRYLESVRNNLLEDPTVGGIVINVRDFTERRELTIAEERARIAREMHDSVAQVLGYVNTQAQTVQRLLARKQVALAEEEVRDLARTARAAYADVREDILGLRSSMERGLLDALLEYVARWEEQSKVSVTVVVPEGLDLKVSPEAELQLLRIIQEALANVRKHAGATTATVEFRETAGWLDTLVEDDGRGFCPDVPKPSSFPRFGISTMRERAESVGGRLAVESTVGRGTRVVVRMPSGAVGGIAHGAANASTNR